MALHYRAQSHFEERWILAQIYFCRGRSAWLASAGEQEEFSGVPQFLHPNNFVFLKPICLNWCLQLGKNQQPRPCRIFFPHICNWEVKPDRPQTRAHKCPDKALMLLLALPWQPSQAASFFLGKMHQCLEVREPMGICISPSPVTPAPSTDQQDWPACSFTACRGCTALLRQIRGSRFSSEVI